MKFDNPERKLPLALIAESDIVRKLAIIFEDSIILNGRFQIVMASDSILRTLGYTLEELAGHSINHLGRTDEDLQPVLQDALVAGFFEEMIISLLTSKKKPIMFGLSGFYLGLISDLNGYIVLKLKNLDILRQLNQQLEENRGAMDQFIYRTAHDLRGPVATIRGLIHLLKNRPDDSELTLLTDMLETSATQLDDRLFKLMHPAGEDGQQPACGAPFRPATQP
jgi:nitrogen-specific signal transduction histidine kinase